MGHLISITEAICNDDITVLLVFSDGTTRLVDIGRFIREHPHPQYNKYLDALNFKKCRLEYGNVVWGNDLEFHVADLYEGRI